MTDSPNTADPHGAFTWGVLDARLDQPGFEIDRLSGSSAGAMKAVVFADGWKKGGPRAARQGLAQFWPEVERRAEADI